MAKKNSFLGAMLKDAFILFAITLIAGVCLGFVNDITKDIIAQRKAEAKIAANQAVSPLADSFEAVDALNTDLSAVAADVTYAEGVLTFKNGDSCEIEEVLSAVDASGNQVGYVVTVVSKDGYSGDIQMSVGIDLEGVITGVEMLTINESAGLGANASKEEFRAQYKDKAVDQFIVTKLGASQDSEIDALSGATITTQAVTNGVNAALLITRALGQN